MGRVAAVRVLAVLSVFLLTGTSLGRFDYPRGDLNGDYEVDFCDLELLCSQWLAPAGAPIDTNGDDQIDIADFQELAKNWRKNGLGVVINEIHSNPDIKTELVEFVELHNAGSRTVDLSGWEFVDGITFTFAQGTHLPPGGFLIVCQNPNQVTAKWVEPRGGIDTSLVYGPFEGKLSNEGERVALVDADGNLIDEVDYQLGFPWPTVGDAPTFGGDGGGYSMQLCHPAFDNDLAGSWRSATPTPTTLNGTYAENIAPHIRQVNHTPKQPTSGEVVTITAKITDPDGVGTVTLLYQLVNPGDYISYTDGRYGTWGQLEMHDDGLDGDELAGDDIYTVLMPAEFQTHRRLVRYRIFMTDAIGFFDLVPYRDDPQHNFAYFVYDGVPAWRGSIRPGVAPVVEYPAEVMRSLPVYHLISKKSDVEECNWFFKPSYTSPQASEFRWSGTLVYEGEVYDHIRYRLRGGVWRQAMGKNMWKFDFNRGHYFQARDDYGRKYDTKWNRLNFSACIQQGSFGQRGEQGMFEALSFRMFNMAVVPASKTNYVHFRVIDEAHEDGTLNAAHPPLTAGGTQHDGDFWGLYMTIEQMDGIFLDEHGLPDGNLYKMDNNADQKNNQGPTSVSDMSDLYSFVGQYSSNPSAQWWGQNVSLDSYHGYFAIYQAVHHGDITEKNWFLYFNPEPTTNEWGTNNLVWQLPWDLDLTWTTYYGSNDPSDPFRRSGVLNHTVHSIANKNRVREINDLLFNSDQMDQLIDEYAAVINDPDGDLSIVDADRAMWDYHWVVGTNAYPQYLTHQASFKADQGKFYQEAVNRGYERTFEGMVQVMKDYVIERIGHMRSKASDSAIPDTPVISYTGPGGHPINALTFQTSAFGDPQGAGTFDAMKWRIAEVTPWSHAEPPPQQPGVVLVADGSDWRYFKGMQEPSTTPGAWREAAYPDGNWDIGIGPIGYGEGIVRTNLNDMRGNYTSIYLRKRFEVADVSQVDKLIVEVTYDDGVNVWINGKRVAEDNVPGENVPFDATASSAIENTNYVRFEPPGSPRDYLNSGTNVIAAQVLNASLSGSSDCWIDVRVIGEKSGNGGQDPPPQTPPNYSRQAGRYEMDAVWESGELTPFNPNVTIPASVVRPGRTYRVRCRMKDNTDRWSHWSAPIQFEAGDAVAVGILADLRVTEVMYNPAHPRLPDMTDNDQFEYIELKNIGDEVLDLSSVSLTDGVTFDFAASDVTTLGPGEFVLVVKDRDAFLRRYGQALGDRVAGEYSGNLRNSGENVVLLDTWNGTIAEFDYGDGRGWPLAADGAGHSLVPLESAMIGQPDGTLNYGRNWRASAVFHGSPGADDPAPTVDVVLNEFMAHTDYSNPQNLDHDSNDWIELYNTTDNAIQMRHWYLSDDIDDLKKWAIPVITIEARGRVTFDEVGDFHNPIDDGFGLDKAGEELILSYLPGDGNDRVADALSFKGQDTVTSQGRLPDGGDFWFRLSPSRDAANGGPVLDAVIDELMYHPVDPNEEYVEIYNPHSRPVDLQNAAGSWRLDGAVNFVFPTGLSIPAGGRLVVVGFDPFVEVSRLNGFVAVYNGVPLVAGVNVIGPWDGDLANRGERLSLEKPEAPDEPGDDVSWVVVDEVIYGDTDPWPDAPDGDGDALQRISSESQDSGNDPDNWQAAGPSPGSAAN